MGVSDCAVASSSNRPVNGLTGGGCALENGGSGVFYNRSIFWGASGPSWGNSGRIPSLGSSCSNSIFMSGVSGGNSCFTNTNSGIRCANTTCVSGCGVASHSSIIANCITPYFQPFANGNSGVCCGNSVSRGGSDFAFGHQCSVVGGLDASNGCFVTSSSARAFVIGSFGIDNVSNIFAQSLSGYLNAWDNRRSELYANAHEAAKIYDDGLFSQRRFWEFYRTVDRYSVELTSSVSPALAGLRPKDLFSLVEEFQLSARQIEGIFKRVVSSLDEVQDVYRIVFAVHETLRREVERLAYCGSVDRSEIALSIKESIRDRILSLAIRTGSSPPAAAIERPAGRKAPLSMSALQVNHATICEQKDRACLPNPIRRKRPATSVNRGAQGYAAPRGLLQSSRRFGYRTDFPMAKRTWPVWSPYRGQMVRDLSLVG